MAMRGTECSSQRVVILDCPDMSRLRVSDWMGLVQLVARHDIAC